MDENSERLKDLVKQRTRELQESENKMRSLLKHSPDVIMIVDEAGTMTYVNHTVEPYKIEDAIGKKIYEFMNPQYHDEYRKKLKVVFQTGQLETISVEGFGSEGRMAWYEARLAPIMDNGKVIFIMIITRDVTSQKESEQKINDSEKKHRIIMENANDMISVTNEDSIVEYINEKVHEKYLLYKKEELINKNVVELIHVKDLSKLQKFQDELDEFDESTVELRFRRKDGEFIWLQMKGKNFVDIDNKKKLLVIARDTTERLQTEHQLKESQALLEATLESNPDGIIVVNENGLITHLNDRMAEMWQLPKDLHENDNDNAKLKHAMKQLKDPELFIRKIRELYKAPESDHDVLEFKDGRIFERYSSPLIIEGNISGRVWNFKDITQRKEAEKKVKDSEIRYRAAYEKADFYKDLFVHDISNILNVILTSTELYSLFLNKQEKIKESDKLMAIINNQVEKGKTLVNNVRKLSQLEDGETISLTNVDVNKILEEAIKFTKDSVNEKLLDINIENSTKSLKFNANELLIDVFENILINSVRYNEGPKTIILIKISKELNNGTSYIKMEFIDNSQGIDDEKKKILFKKGHKKEKNSKGMGFGLSLVKKIMDSYNGQIWVEDIIPGDHTKGSNFILLIPEIQ